MIFIIVLSLREVRFPNPGPRKKYRTSIMIVAMNIFQQQTYISCHSPIRIPIFEHLGGSVFNSPLLLRIPSLTPLLLRMLSLSSLSLRMLTYS